MSSVASRTTINISVKGINNFSQYSPSKVSSQINSPIGPKIDLNTSSSSFIQHSFEISHLVTVLESMQRLAAKNRLKTNTVPDNVTHMSAGERLRVRSNGSEGRSSNTNSTKPTRRSCPHARAVDCITNTPTVMNPALTFDLPSANHSSSLTDPKVSAGERMGVGSYIRDEKSDDSKSSKTKSSSGPRARAERSKTDKAKPKPKDDD